jgi:Tfp pilus assembly protein PilO
MSMSDRDRKILLMVIPFVVIVAYWFLLLGPTRKEASTASAQLTKQEKRRDSAKAEVAQAASAKTDFRSDYTQIVRLGKAIPAQVDMPSLLIQLDGAAKGTGIHFTKITQGERTAVTPVAPAATAGTPPPAGSGESTTPATPPAAAGGQPAQSGPGQAAEGANNAAAQSGVDATTSTTAREGALPVGGGAATTTADGEVVTAPAGLETVPLEMEFVGNFFRLADFFHDVKRFVHVVNTDVVVNGRLVTIDSVSYASDPILFPRLRATIKATVYLSPKTEGATAGATPEGPAATTPATTPAATPAPAETPTPAPTATATP